MTLCRTLLDYISPDSTFAADVVQELESLYPPKVRPVRCSRSLSGMCALPASFVAFLRLIAIADENAPRGLAGYGGLRSCGR